MSDQTNDTGLGAANEPDPMPDADLYLIMEYLHGELDAEQAARVVDRLVADEAFCQRTEAVQLTLSALDEIISDSADPAVVAVLASAAQRTAPATVGDHAAARPAGAATPAVAAVPETATAGARRRGIGREHWRVIRGWEKWKKSRDRRLRPWLLGEVLGYIAASLIIFAGGVTGVGYAARHIDQIQAARGTWDLAHLGVTNDGGTWEATPLQGSSEVRLEPGGRMWIEQIPGSTGSRVRLDGAATVRVSNATGMVLVETAGGEAFLMPGRYRVAMEDSVTMWVRVDSGVAWLRGRKADVGASAGPGQSVRIR